jgi:hypothetical protein
VKQARSTVFALRVIRPVHHFDGGRQHVRVVLPEPAETGVNSRERSMFTIRGIVHRGLNAGVQSDRRPNLRHAG